MLDIDKYKNESIFNMILSLISSQNSLFALLLLGFLSKDNVTVIFKCKMQI